MEMMMVNRALRVRWSGQAPLAALPALLGVIVLAACAGGSPASSATATETEAPTESASGSPTQEATDDPAGETIAPGADLASLLPTSLGGMELSVRAVEGIEAGQLMTEHMGGSAGSIASVLGVDVTELEGAFAATPDADPFSEGGGNVVFAIRYPGAEPDEMTQAVVPVIGGMEWMGGDIEVTEETVGDKDVSVLESSLVTHYFYTVGDVIFIVRTPDRAIAEEALSQLP
jgi:hypothetical protein